MSCPDREYCECGVERLIRDSSGAIKIIVPQRGAVTRGKKLARIDWPTRHELVVCIVIIFVAIVVDLSRNALWLVRRKWWR